MKLQPWFRYLPDALSTFHERQVRRRVAETVASARSRRDGRHHFLRRTPDFLI